MINLTIATIVLFALYMFFAFSDYTVKFYNKRPGTYKVIGMALFFAMSACVTILIGMVFLVSIGVGMIKRTYFMCIGFESNGIIRNASCTIVHKSLLNNYNEAYKLMQDHLQGLAECNDGDYVVTAFNRV